MTTPHKPPDYADIAERQRLEEQRTGSADWRLWGPYLAERAWGTVREDYSADGEAWDYVPHEQARSRAYRWSEDGLGGICDEAQHLCLALALWNGRDRMLKERAFGLTGKQGNRGEDVKEVYSYIDATPSHSWLRYLYKYPQAPFPYDPLVEENAARGRDQAPFNLLDTGAFDEDRYWDLDVRYAKATPTRIQCRISAHNHGPEPAELHLLPTLWFRNTWSWDEPPANQEADAARPLLEQIEPPAGAGFAVRASHPELGTYFLYGGVACDLLFTENETNAEQVWGSENPTPYVKDAFHRHLIDGEPGAVNPERRGTKCAALHIVEAAPGQTVQVDVVLSAEPLEVPFAETERVFATRHSEATVFYDHLLPEAGANDARILRQSLAGMIWTKQFYHYDVARWLDGDRVPPPAQRREGRNRHWLHLKARDIISMPDAWEYPWFAAWDLAYHCSALALVDVDFAKDQVELMLSERYLHPNGQIPAYEWNFGDVNPPVHAMAALKVFRAERVQRGVGDHGFLKRVFHKLLEHAPRFAAMLRELKGGFFRGHPVCACPEWENERGERLLALVDHSMLARVLSRLLDEGQFLSRYGVRSLSRLHATDRNLGHIPGIGEALIDYVPGESVSPMFGGNSNWRGPVWLPTNYSLISSLERYYRFLGDDFRVPAPCLDGKRLHLRDIATLIAERLSDLYRKNDDGVVPALQAHLPDSDEPAWKDQLRFYEYFHAETGQGLGAAHQTGWTGLLANLVMRRYQRDVRGWSGIDRGEKPGLIDEIA